MLKKNVILFRSPDIPRDFSEELELYYNITCVPVLRFTYAEFEPNLINTRFEDYECLVFPSQRAVQAVYNLSIQLPDIKICAVGESTAGQCWNLLGKVPDIVGKQGAKELCLDIVSNYKFTKVLYLCGDNQTTLPYEEFEQAGVSVTELYCYGTREINSQELIQALQDAGLPNICVFFSPSGVKCVKRILEWDWEKVSLVAIGNTTANALLEEFSKCDGMPSEYNLNGIKSLLLELVKIEIKYN
jgi:uroporphyrinogen-III synthase